jgi:hypothetical protein
METLMRTLGAALLATSLLATNAFAGSTLPAGKPSGIRHAQSETSQAVLIALGLGVTGLGIALIASSGKAGGPNSSSNTVTGTAP